MTSLEAIRLMDVAGEVSFKKPWFVKAYRPDNRDGIEVYLHFTDEVTPLFKYAKKFLPSRDLHRMNEHEFADWTAATFKELESAISETVPA